MDDIYEEDNESFEGDYFADGEEMDDEEALDSLASEFDDMDEEDDEVGEAEFD